jgi:hypothetical protein
LGLSKTTTDDSWASFFYLNLFGIIISLRLIIHAFSTKTGIEMVVNDLAKVNGEFYSFEEFERKYNTNVLIHSLCRKSMYD